MNTLLKSRLPAFAVAVILVLLVLVIADSFTEDSPPPAPGPPRDLAGRFSMDSREGRYFDVNPEDGARLTMRSESRWLDGIVGTDIACVMLTDSGLELHPNRELGADLHDLLAQSGERRSALLVLDGSPLCEVWLAKAQVDNDTDPFLTYQLEDSAEVFEKLEAALSRPE